MAIRPASASSGRGCGIGLADPDHRTSSGSVEETPLMTVFICVTLNSEKDQTRVSHHYEVSDVRPENKLSPANTHTHTHTHIKTVA